jgi:hypothetical protein
MRNSKDEVVMARKNFLSKRRFNQLSKDKRCMWMTYWDDETPCTKVARYFNKFINNQMDEFKLAYTNALTEINTAYEDDEAYDEKVYKEQAL